MKPNDKVVCVNDSPGAVTGERLLEKDKVYVTERTVSPPIYEGYGVFIVGVPRAWRANRFRLVSEVGHPPVAIEQPVTA